MEFEKSDCEDNKKEVMRQVGLSSLNESVTLMSTDPRDDMKTLCRSAMDLLHDVKKNNGHHKHVSEV